MGLEALPDEDAAAARGGGAGEPPSHSAAAHPVPGRQLLSSNTPDTSNQNKRALRAVQAARATVPPSCVRVLTTAARVSESETEVDPENLVYEVLAAVRQIENWFRKNTESLAQVMDHPPTWSHEFYRYDRVLQTRPPSVAAAPPANPGLPPLPPLPHR